MCDVIAILIGNGLGDLSSNPGHICFCFTCINAFKNDIGLSLLSPVMDK